MTRTWVIESKLYALMTRNPERLWSLGIEADMECLPFRLLWRDAITGEHGVLCKCQPAKLPEYVEFVLGTIKRIRESEMKLNQPMMWPDEYLEVKESDAWGKRAA